MTQHAIGRKTKSGGTIAAIRQAGPDHQVVTVTGGSSAGYMKKPCPDCPWRKDAVGVFPAEAFKHSANTAYDMSDHVFSCHSAGADRSKTCAGFLLRGADHNMSVRLGYITGKYRGDVSDGGIELHDSYRDMAVANGVDPKDSVLKNCR